MNNGRNGEIENKESELVWWKENGENEWKMNERVKDKRVEEA